MSPLPPDLDRLGEQLATAAGRTLAARRARRERRRRVVVSGLLGALAFALLTPGPLAPGTQELPDARLISLAVPPGCETPRGHGYMLPRCERADAAVSHRPYAWR